MNICFYCDSIFSFGGVQRVLAVVAKALSASHRVTILTMDSPTLEDTSLYELNQTDITYQYLSYAPLRGTEYFPCKAYSLLYKKVLPHTRLTSGWYAHSSFPASRQKLLADKLNEGNYDVIIGVHAFLSIRLATIRQRLNAKKVIGWMHNSFQAFFENKPSYLEGLQNHFIHQMQKLDGLVVLTHMDAALYLQRLQLSPIVIYNPLTLEPKGRSNSKACKFLAVGRMSPRHKGFDILIEGFALFAKQEMEWTLDIVGEGPEEDMLRELITRHKLEKRIMLHPFTKEIQKYYAGASVYVLSSRWEGFGLVLTEAMAHGLPVISSDIPTSRELLADSPHAILFRSEDAKDLANKLLLMSKNKELQQLGDEAIRQSGKFSIETAVKEWENLFKTV